MDVYHRVLVAAEKFPDRGSISDEIGTLQPSGSLSNPAGPSYSNNLLGIINLTDNWSLNLGFLFSLEEGAPPPPGSSYPDSGGHVSLFTVGAGWDSNNHWSFDLLADGSPESTTISGSTLVVNSTPDAARLSSTSSNLEVQLGAGYDTNGESAAEWSFLGSVTGGHLVTDQRITAVEVGRSSLTPAQLQSYCDAHPLKCPRALRNALHNANQNGDSNLDSLKINLGATLTLFDDTDLTLSGDYFLYAEDPAQAGYFNVATAGRSIGGGGGVPIAPLLFDGKLEVAHRFGALSIKLWASAGEYAVDADGITYSGGAKVQYKITRAWRVWVTGSLQHDVDDAGNDTVTWGVTAGVGFRF